MKSSNPHAARVVAEIDINQAVAAIEHFAANYPEDRQSEFIANRLLVAATSIQNKAWNTQSRDAEKAAPVFSVIGPPTTSMFPPDAFNFGGCVSGRIDSSKENPCFGSTEMAEEDARLIRSRAVKKGFGGAARAGDDGLLCRECYTWSNKNEERHQKTCSRRKQ